MAQERAKREKKRTRREKKKERRGALAKTWPERKDPAAITPCWAAKRSLILTLVSATRLVVVEVIVAK
jgi:hypothetical protein